MMAVNKDKPDRWKEDIAQSVDMYNDWFIRFAQEAYRATRVKTTKDVEATLKATNNLGDIGVALLKSNPTVLPTLRMSVCPPLTVDRLIGLAGVSKNLVKVMEKKSKLPLRMKRRDLDSDLEKIGKNIEKMADPDIFVWLERGDSPSEQELYRAATIVADRLCGAVANPIIRNAQERRQLAAIGKCLTALGYHNLPAGAGTKYDEMQPGTFSFRLNVPVEQESTGKSINIPVDAVVMPKAARAGESPLLIEAKSAGDFTNVNKRRKEEATKMIQLQRTFQRYFSGSSSGSLLPSSVTSAPSLTLVRDRIRHRWIVRRRTWRRWEGPAVTSSATLRRSPRRLHRAIGQSVHPPHLEHVFPAVRQVGRRRSPFRRVNAHLDAELPADLSPAVFVADDRGTARVLRGIPSQRHLAVAVGE